MKLRAKASVEVMLWNALWIWVMPNLSHPLIGEGGPRGRAEPVQMVVTHRAIWEQWHTEMSVCPQQLASVSGLSLLGGSDGRVRYLFYAILCIGRKSSYGPIPPKLCSKVSWRHLLCHLLQVFLHFYQKTYFFQECIELLLHCLCTLCAECLHSIHSSFLLSS